jgi:hypothetical protein
MAKMNKHATGLYQKAKQQEAESLLVAVLAINDLLRGHSVLPVTSRVMYCLMTPSLQLIHGKP